MPVIAVGAAIAASVVAGSAVAATVGGIAAISAITAFEVVAAVGATIAAVGAVTRNKTLTMVGGAIGLVGGIGGLAASAGVLGAEAASSAPLFGASPAASAAADTGATFADSLMPATTGTGGGVESGVWDVSGGLSAADNASAGTIDMVAKGMNGMDGRPPPGQEGFQTFSTVSEKVTDPSTTLTNTVSATPPTGLPTTTDVAASQSPITQAASDASNPATYGPTSTFDTGNAAGAGAGTSGGSPNMFERIFDYASKHEKLTSGVLTVGGKLLEGAFSTVNPAQIEALQAQAAANNAAAAMANQQRQNLAMPKAVASSQPVTGTPGSIIPQRPLGMINNQPQLAQVTGAPV